MKHLLIAGCTLFSLTLFAQNTEGSIEYEDVLKFEIELPEEMQAFASQMPTESKTNMVLKFTAKESLYSASEKVKDTKPDLNESGVHVEQVIVGGAGSSSKYTDLATGEMLNAEDMMGKKFLVSVPNKKRNWKILDEQRVVLGYTCIKAELEEDGQTTVAWFSPEIPVSTGPSGYGGLAGAILALEIPGENGSMTIAATEVNLGKLEEKIEKPNKGQRVTEAEFEAIMAQRMKAMQELRGGEEGGNVIIKMDMDGGN